MSANGQLTSQELAPITQGQLANPAAAAWNAMNIEARSLGLELVPTGSMSSYRTLEQQKILYARYLAGGNLAARPGTSNHGWGLAVDVPTKAMRAMIDRIGAKYGWSKQWSDAQSEWWHIKYEAGHWSGTDPGPEGLPPPTPLPEGAEMANLVAVLKANKAIELFVLDDKGKVWHTWQTGENSGWAGSAPGKNASWYSLGSPGK